MGLKSFYLAVNCHFFFFFFCIFSSRGSAPHPAGGHGAPQTPE